MNKNWDLVVDDEGDRLIIAKDKSFNNGIVLHNGNVGVGTDKTYGYRLAIAGKAIAEEIVVKLQSDWPDYVFESGYELPSLQALEQFIKVNKHLPEIPTACEIKESGLPVGEMNALLLKKLEEVTLHLIQINKRVKVLEKENDYQREEIRKLKTM